MRKTKIMSALFIILTLACIGYGIVIVIDEVNYQSGTFINDGYAVVVDSKKNKTNVLNFQSGSKYNYKKYNSKVSFLSNDGNVKVDDSTVIHYQDNSLLVLKDTVGINLNNVDNNIVFYYNIFKNTQINYRDGKCVIDLIDGSEVTFDQLLLRITDSKFLLVGSNIRAILSSDEIVGFDDYVYFEYTDGSVVKIYNNEKYYQTIANNSSILSGDVTINLKEETISKKNKKCISLSNLVIDMDGNVDAIVEDKEDAEKLNVDKSDVDPDSVKNGEGVDGSNSLVDGANGANEQLVDEDAKINEPVYRVTKLALTSLKVDATIEIEDKDSLLSSATTISIVENSTAKTVYDTTTEKGELYGYISYPNLKPDTEYTLYAKASYTIDDVTYDKTFVSKIFRTEALGVSFNKSYATKDSIAIEVNKEIYSKVNSVSLGIYDTEGNEIDSRSIEFINSNSVEVVFDGLNNNTTYLIKMSDILSSGVIIDDGYSIKETVKTLKDAPTVGNLEYAINKRESSFDLNVTNVVDNDYGIVNYRYEIFDARQDLDNSTPVLTISKDKLSKVNVKVDDVKLHRGVAYTYRLVVEFFDNEKTIEYVYSLGSNMQLDGVEFPTLRWEETFVNWEQIKGTIIVDDPSSTIMSNNYRIVYKNSLDSYTTLSLTSETSTNSIPISVNYLRANETYTFDVYATINLQDGNPTVDETYIGSIKVQTKAPNPLRANFQDDLIYTSPFAVDFNLSDTDRDASFEASTLSTVTFTLYQGSGTDGMVEVFRKTTDINTSEYSSTLKEAFYDNVAVINANFFNADSSSFKQKVYTLVVDDAYDYTGYNKIPIENNVYHIKTNAFIPDVPKDNSPQIATHLIVNKYAEEFGLEMNPNLEPNTPIGVSLNAAFNNTDKIGKYIIYHVWAYNQQTEQYEMLENLDRRVDFNSDGTQPNVVFEIGNGTPYNVIDTDMLRRGNNYYFSYEVFIDLDDDGEVETFYPKSIKPGAILKSDLLSIKKQQAIFSMYPSNSYATSFVWKYKYKDIDNSLFENKLYGFANASLNPASNANISKDSNYQLATFNGLNSGDILTIKVKEKLLKGKDDIYRDITSQYFYGIRPSLNLNYSIEKDVNKLVISIDDYINKSQEIASIAYLEAKITPLNSNDIERLGVTTLPNLIISDGQITIDFEDISKYMKTDISVDLIAYYDYGGTGFDLGSTYTAIQKGTYNGEGDNYYFLNGKSINQTSRLYGNMVKSVFNDSKQTLTITNRANNSFTMDLDINSTGVIYQNNNIVLKGIKSEKLNSSNKNTRFDYIIPGISLLDKNSKINITPLLTGASINARLVNNYPELIKENKIYFDLYEVDKNGLNATFVETITKDTSDFNEPIELTNLKLHTNYFLKFYAYVFNEATHTYVRQYLYDVDQKVTGINYNFHTLSNVGVENLTGELISKSYTDKRLEINYNIQNTIGYDYIKYTLYKLTDDGYQIIDVDIPDSKVFMNKMKVEISASPSESANISYGGSYKLQMDIYSNYLVDGVSTSVLIETDEEEFTLGEYEEPFVGISSGKTDDSIFFRVSVVDSSHLIADGTYNAVLQDSKGNVIANFSRQSIDSFNKKFDFNKDKYKLVDGEEYTFIVSVNIDYNNSGTNFYNFISKRSIKCGSDVYLGTITLTPSDSNGINMVFKDPYQLDLIDKISYTITNDSENVVINATKQFTVHYDKDSDAYYYLIEIDNDFNPELLYLVTINFYSGNYLVESAELGYGGHS